MAFEEVLKAIRVFQEVLLLEVLQVLQECYKCVPWVFKGAACGFRGNAISH